MRIERKALLYPAVLLAVLLAALIVPIPGLGPSNAQKAVARQIGSERTDITELKKALQAQTVTANDPARDQINKELDQLLNDLQRDGLTREEALARLSQSEAKLEKTMDSRAPAQREALDQAFQAAFRISDRLKEAATISNRKI